MRAFNEILDSDRGSSLVSLSHGKLKKFRPSGFALISAILVMALLVMVTLAMLSLSTVESRGARQVAHLAEAHANARMSMMLALGELQESMGPDQRVNAASQILETPGAGSTSTITHPRLTGVWTSRNDSLGNAPNYDRSTSFQRWLVSSNQAEDLENMNFALSGSFTDSVEMVSEHTAGASKPENYAKAGKFKIGSGKGAWWVGDENSKALSFPRDKKEEQGSTSLAENLARFATPGVNGIKSLAELENIGTNSAEGDKVISNGLLSYYTDTKEGVDSRPYFHDLTTHSKTVLCNVTQGGLKKDLNLYLEREDINWLADGYANWPEGPNGEKALSPPEDYDVLSWRQLHHYYHSQRMVNYVGGRPTLAHSDSDSGVPVDPITNPRWNSGVTKPALVPVRVQLFLSYESVRDPNNNALYHLRFRMYPVMTLWNPYNVDLTVDGYKILLNTLPLENRVLVNGSEVKINSNAEGDEGEKDFYNWGSGVNNDNGVGTILSIQNSITFKAGESKIFSVDRWGRDPLGTHAWHCYHDMRPIAHDLSSMKAGSVWGWRGGRAEDGWVNTRGNGIVSSPLLGVSGQAGDRITIETQANDFNVGGGSFRTQLETFGWRSQDLHAGDGAWSTFLWSSRVGWRHEAGTPSPAWFSANNPPNATLGTLENAPRPFCVVDARLKVADENDLPSKPWTHAIPAHPFVASASGVTSHFSHAYAVNFKQVSSFAELGEYVQRVPGEDGHGFFGSSYSPSGQTYITGKELPLVALTSIAQLQNLPQYPIDGLNWSGHGLQNNAIANSFASPSIGSNEVKTSEPRYWLDGTIHGNRSLTGDPANLDSEGFVTGTSHIDRSYAANHLLWDEYYFSSMAAQNGSFYQSNGTTRDLREVIEQFYGSNQEPLPNARYLAYTSGKSSSDIVDSMVKTTGGPTEEGYKKSAAHLMVSGGFNVNSTSEVAWANMLASAHLKRPVVLEANASSSPSLEEKGEFIVSRYTMPNGKVAPSAGDELKWRSYRELTSDEINELAKAIVVQVKTRGPFRSLGEFINRRLAGSNDEASLYGALQAALEDPDVEINKDLQTEVITAADISTAGYKFSKAAEGPRAQGSPAYVTQADILQPIAPIITPRSDTFTIRGYGESLSEDGSKVLARAWCEAIVQRYPEYVDSTDDPETEYAALQSETNKKFGRRFRIASFRWLSKEEI